MKLYSILILTLMLINLGCSKQENDSIAEPTGASVTAGACTGNTWAGNLTVNGGISYTHFAYNNSVYFFLRIVRYRLSKIR